MRAETFEFEYAGHMLNGVVLNMIESARVLASGSICTSAAGPQFG
jgi:hypothetical protein